MTNPTAELIAAAIAYVRRQSAPFSGETYKAWERLEKAVGEYEREPK